jgi:hypothetical protein
MGVWTKSWATIESAHPAAKSAANLRDVSIHRLYSSAKVGVRWWGSGAVVGFSGGRRISSETGTIPVWTQKNENYGIN